MCKHSFRANPRSATGGGLVGRFSVPVLLLCEKRVAATEFEYGKLQSRQVSFVVVLLSVAIHFRWEESSPAPVATLRDDVWFYLNTADSLLLTVFVSLSGIIVSCTVLTK